MSLSEQLERGIATLEEHVKGELPVEISVTYSSSPGGIRGMRFPPVLAAFWTTAESTN